MTTTATHRFDALSRRALIAGAAGLVIAVNLPAGRAKAQGMPAQPIAPNVFVRVAPDSTVTVISRNLEMGQGPYTGFATLIADEMDADWSQMRAEAAPANLALYINPAFGMQGTGGSSSLTSSYDTMRRAGALARVMLVEAAAAAWSVPAAEITIDRGVMSHAASGRTGSFGEFAEAASALTAPDSATLTLKDPSQFKFIGKDDGSFRRLDSLAKSTGAAQFSIDIHEPDMLTAIVVRPPRFGGVAASVDDAEARAVRGVVDVKTVPMGVAVLATSTWPALKASRLVKPTWDETNAEKRGTAELRAEFEALLMQPGLSAGKHGDVDAAFADADQVVEAIYEFPYLAHAPMEPLNGFIHWKSDNTAYVKFSSQVPSVDKTNIAMILGLPEEAVTLDVTLAGGSFGRRGQFKATFAEELAHVAKAFGPGRPIKLQWTRENDIKGGYYRPMMLHRFRASVKGGAVTGWASTTVGQSLVKGTMLEAMLMQGGIDMMGIEGLNELPYEIANFSAEAHVPDVGVPPLFWRSVGHSHTGFAKESFMDEALAAAGLDPVEGRLALMPEDAREARVLREVRDFAGWTGPGPNAEGHAFGVAVVTSFGTTVAQIAEVSNVNGQPKVHKIWAAVDCGMAVNPDVVRAQVEGGVGYGLGHALYAGITMTDGVVDQANFDSYRSIRIHEMPAVEVRIIPSTNPPTGIGEPGLPPAAPAVANAMVALGMERPRRLPIVKA